MNKGFTLIETIITIVIFALLMGVVSGFIVLGYRTQSYSFQQSMAIGEARKGIETMVKEIREARGGDDGSYVIEKAEDYEFIFYSDIDKDEATERVRYFVEGTDFKKGVIDPAGWPIDYLPENEVVTILSRYVRNGATLVFTYYNGDWPGDTVNNPLPTPARLKETKLMHVYLIVNVDPNRPPQNFDLESDAQIRNLKTNL